MSESSNKLIKFWEELKRRKVFKVTAMYAGTAFIILQLFDIIAQPLQLPAWTMTFVIVLLCIGFIITLLIAWIYDITPEGIKKTESIEVARKKKSQTVPVKRRLKASDIIITAMAIVIVILLYPKIFNRDKLKDIKDADGRISVAVMPFQNMTNDTIWNVWQDGIQNELITSLTNSEGLKVRQIESITGLIQSKGLINYASITPSVASTLSQKLGANIFIYGSIKQVGNTIRVNAQLIDSKTQDGLKSFQIDGKTGNILQVTDSLSRLLQNFLIISKLKKDVFFDFQDYASTNSPEAYRYFTYGQKAFLKRDYPIARNWFLQALAIDSNFYSAMLLLPVAYAAQGLYDQANKQSLRAYQKRNQMPVQQKIFANWLYAAAFETHYERIKYLKQLLEFDDQVPLLYFQLGNDYSELYQYDNAIIEFEKAIEIYKKWDSKPMWVYNYIFLGIAYQKTGQYMKEKDLYKKAEQDFPEEYALIQRQAILSLTEGDMTSANRYIEKYVSNRKSNSWPEASISTGLAGIYSEAGILGKAEEYYRNALSLEPQRPNQLNNLAWFLIDNDRNINEGLELVDKALGFGPDDYSYLHTKGWGLYKQGRYKDALEILQKSWDLKPVYDHGIYLNLEAAKKAVANQKRTDR
jgi:tetratricopeptide (TPR) repeat protein